MTALTLRLEKSMYGTAALAEGGGVLATVESIGSEPTPRRVTTTIPVGIGPAPATLDVPSGRYVVRAYLPNGDIVSQQVELEGPLDVVLQGKHSPHEWLSFQHLLGNVAGAQAYDDQSTAMLAPHPSVWQLDPPGPGPTELERAAGWTFLNGLARDLRQDISGFRSVRLAPMLRDDRVQFFTVWSAGPPASPGTSRPQGGRRWLFVDDDRGRATLASLPFPWRDVSTGQDAEAEVLVHRGDAQRPPAVAVSIRDSLVSTVLGYLASSAFTCASDAIRPAREMVMRKRQNALAAALGGYTLVSTSLDVVAGWHDWVHNLTNWFPWLPDGPIIQARLFLQLAREASDLELARGSLREAFSRGIPYYSLGLQWLVDGLTVFAEEDGDGEMAAMLAAVRPVARRGNLQQPFTVLDLTSW